ncbi:Coiled-coil domain-containing protein 96 [Trichoplax sp. H2]|nr:Coiled-coil domain-containing protein 96 [Trichoplax sp. H2]|eukprot:RDD40624.1 Coiled-coil domain-containing protein 96 [Trichoplax sp. H2]
MSTNVEQDDMDNNSPQETDTPLEKNVDTTNAETGEDSPLQNDNNELSSQQEIHPVESNTNEVVAESKVEVATTPIVSENEPHEQVTNDPTEENNELKEDENTVENSKERSASQQSIHNADVEKVEEGVKEDTPNANDEAVHDPTSDTDKAQQDTDDTGAVATENSNNDNNNQDTTEESPNDAKDVIADSNDVEQNLELHNEADEENTAENENQHEGDEEKEQHEDRPNESGRNSPAMLPLTEKLDEADFTEELEPRELVEDLDARQTPTSDYYDQDMHSINDDIMEGEESDDEDEYNTSKEEIEEFEVPKFDRAFLLERYQMAFTERDQVNAMNLQLQHKLAEHFRKKKTEEKQDLDRNVTDQEQRYLKYMSTLEELHKEETRVKENIQEQIEELVKKRDDKQDKVSQARNEFTGFKKEAAKNAINSRSGKTIPQKDIDQYLALELRKDNEVMQVRLENIKSKNKLKKREVQLKQKEELAEGLHLIDFEQLKIENQTYNEKIEERNEEILKLRKKITSTVQVLTHVKEKLQFVQAETGDLKDDLKEVEVHVAQKRDILSRNKQVRDALRIENVKLREKCGLLGNEPLLRDYEEKKDEGDYLLMRLEQLKMTHAELTLKCNGVRQKIEQARSAPTYG